MAFRTWGRMLLAAVGVAAFAGAAQLGFAYGLGVVRFGRVFDPSAEGLWAAQVTWVAWFAMVAAVAGAVAVAFLANRRGVALTGMAPRLAVAGASAVGALAVAPLAMLPARAATLTSISPTLTAGLGAVLGALIGMAAALATLSQRPFRWNAALVIGGVWLLALLSVAPSLGPADPLPDVRLGVADPASFSDASATRLAVLTMPALGLLAGLVSGLLARSGGYSTVVGAGCGAIGPALLTLAYLAAGPGGGDSYQAAPYWGALIGTGAGALGSVLATVLHLPRAAPERDVPAAPGPGGAAPGPAGTPTIPSYEPDGGRDAATSPPEPAESPAEQASPRPPEPAGGRPEGAWFDEARRPAEEETGATSAGDWTEEPAAREHAASSRPPAAEAAPVAGRHAAQAAESRNATAGRGTADATTADARTAEPETAGRDEAKRGLFRRSRRPAASAAPEPTEAAPESQRTARGRDRAERPIRPRDEEYVSWVSGLGGADDAADGEPQTRRTFRRQAGQQAD